jgi:GNAT superfamily N-acetyltransferase
MNLRIRELTERSAALELSAEMDRAAAWSMAEFRDEPLPPGVSERFFARWFDAPECLVLVALDADAGDQRLGFCCTAPLEDPLTGERIPLIAILYVDPGARHRGVASALVRRARELLRERGQPALAARAGHNDDALISMGERAGFTRVWELMVRD